MHLSTIDDNGHIIIAVRLLTHRRSLIAMHIRNVRAIRSRNKACTTATRIGEVLTGWTPAAFETVAFACLVVTDAAIGAIDVTFVARHSDHIDLYESRISDTSRTITTEKPMRYTYLQGTA